MVKFGPAVKIEAQGLRNQGKTAREVAKELGISLSWVERNTTGDARVHRRAQKEQGIVAIPILKERPRPRKGKMYAAEFGKYYTLRKQWACAYFLKLTKFGWQLDVDGWLEALNAGGVGVTRKDYDTIERAWLRGFDENRTMSIEIIDRWMTAFGRADLFAQWLDEQGLMLEPA